MFVSFLVRRVDVAGHGDDPIGELGDLGLEGMLVSTTQSTSPHASACRGIYDLGGQREPLGAADAGMAARLATCRCRE